ncbi:hypothetical protein NP493_860g01005 [Ridgeia piscesae]|uniref:Uncharacterized protein n=1 Tax=Ridgeia piscesae TaxID=27915 RepID=A0AAD9KL72_RIDPI|nr:hypothetical protein NP493_860g01005 [Ridgeia piscesae]
MHQHRVGLHVAHHVRRPHPHTHRVTVLSRGVHSHCLSLKLVHTDPACWDCDRATTLMINSMTQLILDDGIHIWYGLQQDSDRWLTGHLLVVAVQWGRVVSYFIEELLGVLEHIGKMTMPTDSNEMLHNGISCIRHVILQDGISCISHVILQDGISCICHVILQNGISCSRHVILQDGISCIRHVILQHGISCIRHVILQHGITCIRHVILQDGISCFRHIILKVGISCNHCRVLQKKQNENNICL